MIDISTVIDAAGTIVAAFLSNHKVPRDEIADLISSVANALKNAQSPKVEPVKGPAPPVPINKTITPDAIISLEDGRPYRMLKRHLATRGLTPNAYCEKWGLPSGYPMTAVNYSAMRSAAAKKLGLGGKQAGQASEPQPVKRGKPRKPKAAAD